MLEFYTFYLCNHWIGSTLDTAVEREQVKENVAFSRCFGSRKDVTKEKRVGRNAMGRGQGMRGTDL